MAKFIVTKEPEYQDGFAGFTVGDIVESDWNGDQYGGFVWLASKPRPEGHKAGCAYHSGDWCNASLEPYYAPKAAPVTGEYGGLPHVAFKELAEYSGTPGQWFFDGFAVGRWTPDTCPEQSCNGWRVLGIDPVAVGETDKPFRTMREAMAWIWNRYDRVSA